MDTPAHDYVKHREIAFVEMHPDPDQARSAALLLADVKGVLRVNPVSPLLIQLSYDLLDISLEEIEDALREIGLHLDNSLLYRLKRSLYYYTEETQRANIGCPKGESNCTKKVFAVRYQKLNHACRDNRPEHWRRYL